MAGALLAAAIDQATDGNRSAFGRLLGHSDGSRVRAWLRAEPGADVAAA